jgi:hypothetical protein
MPTITSARNPFFSNDYSILATEDATKRELTRIEQLAPSKSAELNTESLREARTKFEAYSSFPEELSDLEKISVEGARKRATEAVTQLILAIKDCKKNKIQENLLIIERQLEPFFFLGFGGPFMDSNGLSESEEATIQGLKTLLQTPPEKICTDYKDAANLDTLPGQIDAVMNISANQLAKRIASLREQAPRAKMLAAAWGKRQDTLRNSIEDQSAPASRVADQLGVIIGVFCAFGILMFTSVKVFSPPVQLELIASGQVIQFATVMVLLIVICILGMSKFLTENTLGTLLGGIGGYVLSQGVGRAMSRAATRDSQSQTKPIPTGTDTNP